MSDLLPLRERIDSIDAQLVVLLNERASVALEIGAIKEKLHLPVYAPIREEELLCKIESQNTGPLTSCSLRFIYREIMSASLSIEKDLRVLCAGNQGQAVHQATVSKFGSSLEYQFTPEIADVFLQVEKKQADFGVIPIWLHGEGVQLASLASFMAYEVFITAEIQMSQSDSPAEPNRFFVLGNTRNPASATDHNFLVFQMTHSLDRCATLLILLKKQNLSVFHCIKNETAAGVYDFQIFAEVDGDHKVILEEISASLPADMVCSWKIIGNYPKIKAAYF